MHDHKRWLSDDGDALPHERRLLQSGRELGPSREQEQALWASIGAGIGSAGGQSQAPSNPTAAPSSAVTGAGVKAIVLVGILGAIGAGVLLFGRQSSVAPVPAPSVALTTAESVTQLPALPQEPSRAFGPSDSVPISVNDLPIATGVQPRGAMTPQIAPAASAPAPSEEKPAAAAPTDSAPLAPAVASVQPESERAASMLREESQALERARQALHGGDAVEALRRLNQMAARFPRGVLGQEREALTIEALAMSGQRAVASQRAAAFLRANPNSPHAARLRSYLRDE